MHTLTAAPSTLTSTTDADDETPDAARTWLRNRAAAPHFPAWCGAHALAALVGRDLVDHGPRILAPDASVLWATLVMVPLHSFGDARQNPVLAATYRTAFRFGMPLIGGPRPLSSCDFARRPLGVGDPPAAGDRARDYRRGMFDGLRHPRLFRLYNGMWAALLAEGYHRQRAWAYADRGRAVVAVRRERAPALPPRVWAPRAYLAFPAADLPGVFRLSFRPGDGGRPQAPAVLAAFLAAFRDGLPVLCPWDGRYLGLDRCEPAGPGVVVAVHRVGTAAGVVELRLPVEAVMAARVNAPVQTGDTLAHFGPDGGDLRALPRGRLAWEHALGHFGEGVGVAAACWYGLQALSLPSRPGLAYLPSALAGPAARDLARDADLLWDVTPAEALLDPGVEAFRFPPLLARNWDDWRGTLPGEVAYDFTPRDGRVGSGDGG